MAYLPSGWMTEKLILASELARAAYKGEAAPEGWRFFNLHQLEIYGLPEKEISGKNGQYFDSKSDIFFDNANASVLLSGNNVAITFRGTESGFQDKDDWTSVLTDHGYIDLFSSLLRAVYRRFGDDVNYIFSGHSLGGAAVNQLAGSLRRYGDFSHADLYAIASPQLHKSTVKNFGFDDDLVYGLADPQDQLNTNDNTIIVNFQSDTSIFGAPNPNSAHDRNNYVDAIKIISSSRFYQEMNYDSYLFITNTLRMLDIDDKFSRRTSDIYVIGSKSGDSISGTGAQDHFEMLSGDDVVHGFSGKDYIYGGYGEDDLYGGNDSDLIEGENNNDNIIGGLGKDKIFGGSGNDIFYFETGDVVKGEVIDGGSLLNGETNTATATGNVDFRLTTISNVNRIVAQASGELHFSDAQIQALLKDKIEFSGAGNLLIDANGPSKNYAGLAPYIAALTGHLILNGTEAAESMVGTSHDDILYGQGGDDVLDGAGGYNVLSGGGGNDKFVVHEGGLAATINGGSGSDALLVDGNVTLDDHLSLTSIEGVTFAASGKATFGDDFDVSRLTNVTGSSGTDQLYFQPSGSIDLNKLVFSNWGAADTVTIEGGSRVVGSSRADTIVGASYVRGGEGNDVITGSGYLDGGADVDHITGSSGNDTLVGDNSGDVLIGGTGQDVFDLYAAGISVDAKYHETDSAVFHYNAVLGAGDTDDRFSIATLGYGASNVTVNLTGPSRDIWIQMVVHGNSGGNVITYGNNNSNLFIYGNGGADTFIINGATNVGAVHLMDFESGEDKIVLSGISKMAEPWELRGNEIAAGYYLTIIGDSKLWAVIDHEYKYVPPTEDQGGGNTPINTTMCVIASNGDYLSPTDFGF